MDTSGDLHDEEGMVALCFEKNTFLDVVLLPEECRTQQTSGHRRCNSDSTHGRTPQELLALSGDVVAWPEISTLALGMMPAGDQESCFKTSVASRTVGNDGDKCKEEQEIDEWTSESNTFQWDSQDGGKSPEAARTLKQAKLPSHRPRRDGRYYDHTLVDELDEDGATAFMQHWNGTCTPCIFWLHGCCKYGGSCRNCHNEHPKSRVKQIRLSKQNRQQVKEFEERPHIFDRLRAEQRARDRED